MAKRRLKKRQGPSSFRKSASKFAEGAMDMAKIRAGYEALTQGYKIAKAVKQSAPGKGRGRKMKKKDPDSWKINEADGIKFRNYQITYKRSKLGGLVKSLAPMGDIYEYFTGGVGSAQGQQQAAVASKCTGLEFGSLYSALLADVAFSSLGESRKMFVGTVGHQIQFNNAGNSTLDFDIYILLDKNTTALESSPGTIWDNGIISESTNATPPGEAKTDLWSRPTTHKLFNINYWTRRLHCSLTPGENCRLDFKFKMNRHLDTQYWADYNGIRGLSHYIMIVSRGSLGDGAKGFAVAPGEQTITPSKLIWVVKRYLTGSVLSTTRKVHRQLNSELPSTLTDLFVQDEDSGAIEDTMDPTNYV